MRSVLMAQGATNANAAYTGVNGSQQEEQTESFRFPEFRVPEVVLLVCNKHCNKGSLNLTA